MKKLIIFFLLLSQVCSAQIPLLVNGNRRVFNPVFVNGQSESGSGITTVVLTAFNLTAGNTVLAGSRYGWDGVNIVQSVTDDALNTYVKVFASTSVSNIDHEELWVATNCNGHATNKITWHFAPGQIPANFWGGNVQYSGVTSVDVNANGSVGGSATSVTTGTFTTTTANQLAVFVGTVNATGDAITATISGAAATQRAQDAQHVLTFFDKQFSAIQTGATATMTSNNARSWIGILVTLK